MRSGTVIRCLRTVGLNDVRMKKALFSLALITSLLSSGYVAFAKHPSRANLIGNVEDSLQMQGGATYNPVRDEYFVVYQGDDQMCGVRIDSDGRVISNTRLAPASGENTAYWGSDVEHNPDTDTYLLTYRRTIGDDPQKATITARYLNGEGEPISPERVLANRANSAHIEYNPVLNNYMVAWNWVFEHTNLIMLSGNVSGDPVLTSNKRVEDEGWQGNSSFSTEENKFLFVNGHGHTDGTNGSDIWGHIVSSDGKTIGSRFPIAATPFDETGPSVAYAPSTNQWMVLFQRHTGRGNPRGFDVQAAFVDANGNVTQTFFVVSTEMWDAPKTVEFNLALDRFVVGWFAGSSPRIGLVNPHDGSFTRVLPDDIVTTPRNSVVGDGMNDLATRPDFANPQAFVYWREGHGLTGAHGTIVDLRTGVETAVTGGGIPCRDAPQVSLPPVTGGVDDEDPDDDFIGFVPPTGEGPALTVDKFVRNISKGESASRKKLLQVDRFDILQFIIHIRSNVERTVNGLVVEDQLPSGMTFREGSTLVDGAGVSGDDIIADGLAIGSIGPRITRTVRWSAQVTDLGLIPASANVLEVPVAVDTDNDGIFFSEALLGFSDAFIAARTGPVDPVAAVIDGLDDAELESEDSNVSSAAVPSTGPGGTTVLAFVGAVLASLAYAGYTRTHGFHLKQVREIAKERNSMNFKD